MVSDQRVPQTAVIWRCWALNSNENVCLRWGLKDMETYWYKWKIFSFRLSWECQKLFLKDYTWLTLLFMSPRWIFFAVKINAIGMWALKNPPPIFKFWIHFLLSILAKADYNTNSDYFFIFFKRRFSHFESTNSSV